MKAQTLALKSNTVVLQTLAMVGMVGSAYGRGLDNTDLLVLDPSIRDWVVFPIVLMLFLVGIGRQAVQQLLKSDPVITETSVKEMRYKQTLMYANIVQRSGGVLNETAFNRRRSHLVRKGDGLLREKVPGAPNPMSNPLAMVDMMKGNITFMVPNFVMMTFVSYFFTGFVCLKVPFPMPSSHFKLMLQRGVDMSTLDVSYVSSLSWYFLVTFGINGIFRLILGNSVEFDDMQMMSMQMGMMGGGAGGNPMGFDAAAAYKQERQKMGLIKHDWAATRVEKKILGDRYPDEGDDAGEQIDLSVLS